MNTRGAKAKGRSLQNRIARDLAEQTGLRYGSPNDDLADLRGRLMGTPGEDIVRSSSARSAVPFFVECKNTESWSFGSRIFSDGLGQLIRWYLGTVERAQKAQDLSQNIPLVIAAKAHFAPIVVIADQSAFLSSRWNTGSLIVLRVPLTKFVDRRLQGVLASEIVNILAWEDFLQLWYGKK